MKIRVIFNDEEWQAYKDWFTLGRNMHDPSDPPSFPVLVATEVVDRGYGALGSQVAQHSFIEAHELKRMLGLA